VEEARGAGATGTGAGSAATGAPAGTAGVTAGPVADATGPAGLAATFAAGGAMGALMSRYDWSATPLGPVPGWAPGLVSATSICLQSRFPMIIFWGPELAQVYNDAYRPMLGTKHPASLGQPARVCWSELWDVIGPMLHGVLDRGEATFSDDLLLLMDRYGYPEETYFTFSYSPIRDAHGRVEGVFCAVVETTERVVGERRLRTLRELPARQSESRTAESACRTAATTLAGNPYDVPFALLYLVDPDGSAPDGVKAALVAAAGIPPGDELAPDTVDLADPAGPWPLGETVRSPGPVLVELPAGPEPADPARPAPTQALILPLAQPTAEHPAGLLVAAINPLRPLDDGYRGFFDLVAGHVATAIADARAYEEERRRAEALAELDRAKTTFFSNISHEFRTPLTLLLGPLEEALAAEPPLPGAQRERVQVAHRNAMRLLKLVNTLLDFSRLESGRIRAQFEPVELGGCTAELAGMFRAAMERVGLKLTVDCPPLPEPVYVDREMWEQIVMNLLSNAFKYTFEGGIEVRLRPAGDAVELTVRDTGVGIPADQLPLLFERFHRLPDARGRTHEGTGIGLSLVYELVGLHHGAVEVSSEVDAGSTFTVRIRLGTAHLEPDQVGPVRGRQISGDAARYVDEALQWSAEPVPAAPAGAPGSSVVLVADDHADMRSYLRRILGAHWTVRLASDGQEALRMAREERPDLVVTDVMMPGLGGFGLLRELRADPVTRAVPVIVLSARAGQESTVEGLEAGADDYLTKPFTAAELVARVRTHLTTARVRDVATRRMRSLANASHALSTSLDATELVEVLTTLVVPQWADECVVWLRERTRVGDWRIVPHGAHDVPPDDGLLAAVRADAGQVSTALGIERVFAAARPHQARLPGGPWTLTLPLHARGSTVGALTVGRRRGGLWRATDLEYLVELARRLGLALDNAARFSAERSVAVTLQRSLLPSQLPEVAGVLLAARYLPGGQGTTVGGDWYDAFTLPSGNLALAIGDVMGRGVRAAAIMGQLRAALRGYALEELTPADLLARLDAFVEASGEPHLSTCLYAIFDPATRVLRIAGAGHLPPLVVSSGGDSSFLEFPVGLPLGVGAVDGITYADHEVTLEPAATLLFYTDGLIESRQQSLDEGMQRLLAATRRRFSDPNRMCDHLLAQLDGDDGDDDSTLLAICLSA
jgi:signal transduction histidine kinase/serine phosphatase RsbU (regulator of sigma subunit)/DNA-binding NarL/FixJ family response regulator